MKPYLLLSSLLLLSGCLTNPSLMENTTQKQITIAPEVMEDCKTLTSIMSPQDSFERTLVLRAEDVKAYYNCSILNDKKKVIIKKYILNEGSKQTKTGS